MELGLRSLSISGGEPFIHPESNSIINICASKRLDRLSIYTSGVLCDSEGDAISLSAKATLEAVKQSGAVLIFNIQSWLPEVHDKIVGAPGRLEIVLTSIRNAIAHDIPVECHIVPNKQNVDSLAITARKLIMLGVQRVSFLRLVPQGYAKMNRSSIVCSYDEEERMLEAFRSLLKDEDAQNKYRFGVPFSGACQTPSHCQAGTSKLIMRWDGMFFPCEAFKESGREEFSLGGAFDHSLSDILDRVVNCSALHQLKTVTCGQDPCPAQSLYSS